MPGNYVAPAKVEGTVARRVFMLLTERYSTDPSWFDTNWPELGEALADVGAPPRRAAPPFGLTENERRFRVDSLKSAIASDYLIPDDAITALEHCASLLRDDWTTNGIPVAERARLFKVVSGKSHKSLKLNSVIPVGNADDIEPAHHISLLRGVVLDMDVNMRLLSITVTPRKVREVKKLMNIAGIGSDSESDVARRHDAYLAEASPHGDS